MTEFRREERESGRAPVDSRYESLNKLGNVGERVI